MLLSPGQHYLKVPKDPLENLAYRHWIHEEASHSKSFRESVRAMCAEDILFYTNACVWTYDPRLGDGEKYLPFNTWSVQDAALHAILKAIEDGRDLVIEKSRDMGASWMCLLCFEWLWHWKQGVSFMMVSRKYELVEDRGNYRSLFGKVDLLHSRMPNWMMPNGWNPRKHRNNGQFTNPEFGGTIRAETTTTAAGVGDRDTAILADEFSRWEPKEARLFSAGTVDTSNCRIFNFTPFGTANTAYLMAMKDNFRKLRLFWASDPRKNWGMYQYDAKNAKLRFYDWDEQSMKLRERAAWAYPNYNSEGRPDPNGRPFDFILDGVLRSPYYDDFERRHSNRREMAQMWDIDYAGSSFPFFDKMTLQDHITEYARDPVWEGDMIADEELGTMLKLVKVANGPIKLWLSPDGDGNLPESEYGYSCGVDTSLGKGVTNSCASFYDNRTGRKVATIVSPFIAPKEFAVKVVSLCRLLKDHDGNTTELAWETGGPGTTFGDKVLELRYRRIYFRTNEKVLKKVVSDSPGWVNTRENLAKALSEYQYAMQTRMIVNCDRLAVSECEFYVHIPGGAEYSADSGSFDATTGDEDPTGAKENHGDRVVSDALAVKLVLSKGKLTAREKPQQKALNVNSLAWRRALVLQRERQLASSPDGDY